MRSSVRRQSVYVVTVVLLSFGLRAEPAGAFCGFFAGVSDAGMVNSSTQTVIVRECDFTTLTLAFNYRGDPGEFTVVFPVPVVLTEHDVRVVDRELIQRLDTFTAPRAVRFFGGAFPGGGGRARGGGGSGALDETVVVEAEFVAGEYEIVILSANESGALFTWLADQGFQLPDHATPILQRYIDKGMLFLAAKVTLAAQARDGFAFLSPLQMTFESQNFCLPILMGTINAESEQDLLIYTITAGAEVQVENYPTVRLDRSADFQPADWASFNEFVTARFDATRAGPDLTVVTEYVGPVNKGDPPTTNPITREELRQLGYRGETTPHVTRLHLRYSPEQVVDDLQFTTVPPRFFTPNFTRLPIPGDFDSDGDLDLADYIVFTACVRGSGRPLFFSECRQFDFDGDGDVDLADALRFQGLFTGAR